MSNDEPEAVTVSRTCLMQAVRRASRLVTAHYEKALAPTGLSAGQFTILTALAVGEAPSIAEIGRRIGADRTTLSRLLGPLRRRGLVGAGSKAQTIALTETGRAVYRQALPLWTAEQARLTDSLGEDDAARLRYLLQKL